MRSPLYIHILFDEGSFAMNEKVNEIINELDELEKKIIEINNDTENLTVADQKRLSERVRKFSFIRLH